MAYTFNSDITTFVPRYPWNDDERDTSSFIAYCSECHESQDIDDYIPTFQIMKEYYQEQRRELYCEPDYVDDHCNNDCYFFNSIDPYFDDDSYSLASYEIGCGIETNSNDYDDVVVKSEDEDDNVSSPYVSNKYWYM